jgi:multicomponent Na+:H+ antiporter subunit D
MNNILILPIIIPLLTAMVLFFFKKQILLQRSICILSLVAISIVSGYLIYDIDTNGVQVLHIGGWEAPFGISLVADMMPALLVFTSSLVCIFGVLYASGSISEQHERFYVYPFILLLLCGVNGSFLTGDIFNLFVFFEVMLIASYVLLSLGGGKRQLREALKYVMINMISSTLFVVAIAYLYSIIGTLNMAHLSERIAISGQDGLSTAVSILFLVVFSIKAALVLYFWLPGSYSVPPAAISAIFAALLSKVGIYAILRLFTLIFYHQPGITHTILIWMGAATMIFGAIGAVAYWGIRKILAYNVIISVGLIIFGIGIATSTSLSGALYYLIHDMLAKALIFILGGAIISIAGTDQLRDINGLIRYRPLLGWLFFLSALALAGVPPLSGFVGKMLILQGGVEEEYYVVTIISVLTSLLVLYSVMKVFIQSFWGETLLSEGEEKATGKSALLPGAILASLLIAMGVGADWVLPYVDKAVEVLLDPSLYIDAVLLPAEEVVLE